MDYDIRNNVQYPLFRTASSTPSSTPQSLMYRYSVYPKVAVHPHASLPVPPPITKPLILLLPPPFSGRIGCQVCYIARVQDTSSEVSRSNFQFDLDFERKILAEAEKGSQNWSRLAMEKILSRIIKPTQSGRGGDPVVSKYIASGLSPEAVSLAVANYRDTPVKVRKFVREYTLLQEMGFSFSSVAEALVTHDNDLKKHWLISLMVHLDAA